MKNIFFLLASASIGLMVSCSGGKSGSTGKPGIKGELIPKNTSSASFVAQRPHAMVAIPGGSFVMGMSDMDFTNSPEKASLKTVTVSPFFMDETETTNADYRVFVNYVRDSIARTLLAEKAGDNASEEGISKFSYLSKKANDQSDAYQKFLESKGGRDGYDESKRLDWKAPLSWRTSDYADEQVAEVLESMYVPAEQTANNVKSMDWSKIKYRYNSGAKNAKAISLAVYPDTTVWAKDFHYAYNEPMLTQYFSNKEYNDYPVVGVTWDQARAYCDFRTKLKSDYNASLRAKKQRPMSFRLPTEAEWEYAAKGGLENATYPWGGPYLVDDRGCYLANFKPKRGNYIESDKKGYTYTAPVKKFPKNGFGLYDMAGNVSEWTESPYNNSTYGFSSTLNPTIGNGIAKDAKKSVRGGSWKDVGYMLMSGYRDYENKDSARSYIGFRTVQDIPEGAVKFRRKTN